jgi:hypothetical protein
MINAITINFFMAFPLVTLMNPLPASPLLRGRGARTQD